MELAGKRLTNVTGQRTSMDAAAQHDTVWIGFIDIVPVIGTVKEGVEWVMASYQENKMVVKQINKAIKELCAPALPLKAQADQEALVEPIKKLTLSKTSDGGPKDPEGMVASASAEPDLQEVKLEELLEYVYKVKESKMKTPSHKPQEEAETKKLQKIQDEMLEKIRCVLPNYTLSTALKRETKRSKKGEHVFNNGILKFHQNLQKNIQKNLIEKNYQLNWHQFELIKPTIQLNLSHTLTDCTVKDIGINMVVDFDETVCYVNANSYVYGVYCSKLHSAVLKVLLSPGLRSRDVERVNTIIDHMNNKEIYVDQMAKAKWIDSQRKRNRFNQVRDEVADMYKNLCGYESCIRIKSELNHVMQRLVHLSLHS